MYFSVIHITRSLEYECRQLSYFIPLARILIDQQTGNAFGTEGITDTDHGPIDQRVEPGQIKLPHAPEGQTVGAVTASTTTVVIGPRPTPARSDLQSQSETKISREVVSWWGH
ncbi:hypothetical protein EVAR_17352_1 [Eumeta japonica]|uniref:Uncharacterized protein n=1 Tax=Eumeta variegata TaxID=151549 RepID=A0A4C1WG14_EUMVA|nr:hypothetical protein EVAR_17352_1 [Eumeta japonica]